MFYFKVAGMRTLLETDEMQKMLESQCKNNWTTTKLSYFDLCADGDNVDESFTSK